MFARCLRCAPLLLLCTLPLGACRSKAKPATASPAPVSEPQAAKPPSSSPPSAPDPNVERFGEALKGGDPVALSRVLTDPDAYRSKTVRLAGDVRRACTRRGCWMELAESLDPKAPGCRITFKDYGFFVPTNSAGAKATVEGVVNVETVQASHVRHLEEEGATFAKKEPDGTAKEVQLVAYGVELRR